MKMHVLSGGRLRMRKSVYLPDADRAETIDLPVSCYLLRHAQGNVLFDTGCHPSTTTDAEARWGAMAKAMNPISMPDENLIAQLALVGLAPHDIDVVVNSHFHSDHCGCNEFFRNATVFCHRKELDAAAAPDGVQKGYLPVDWQQPMPIETFDGERDLYDDGRIVLLPLPGHTVGMTAALVALDRGGRLPARLRHGGTAGQTLDREINAEATPGTARQLRRLLRRGSTAHRGRRCATVICSVTTPRSGATLAPKGRGRL